MIGTVEKHRRVDSCSIGESDVAPFVRSAEIVRFFNLLVAIVLIILCIVERGCVLGECECLRMMCPPLASKPIDHHCGNGGRRGALTEKAKLEF